MAMKNTTKGHIFAKSSISAFLVVWLACFLKFLLYAQLVADEVHTTIQWLGIGCISAATAGIAALLFSACKHNIAQWVGLILIDLWLIANILFFNANGMLIDLQLVGILGELNGFEASVISYLIWQLIVFPLLTIGCGIYLLYDKKLSDQKKISTYGIVGIIAAIIVLYGVSIPCDLKTWEKRFDNWMYLYASKTLTREEEKLAMTTFSKNVPANEPEGHLVFILVESMESWPLHVKDKHGTPVYAQLQQYIQTHPVLLCEHVLTQQVYGRSGDGQLITQTGMLPLRHGVACIRNGRNVYPNFAHFYPDAVIINPFPRVWNQHVTTYSYGYKRLKEPPGNIKMRDSVVFEWAKEQLEAATVPTCVLAITLDMHVPFRHGDRDLLFDEHFTAEEQAYMQCCHGTDRHIGQFLAWADTAAIMHNATIVITADHNQFPRKDGKGLCPLIIRSPKIQENRYVPTAYQMDVFPTVLDAIGQDNYFWHGFGVDLLAPDIQRVISPKQAETISDKWIRSDYFSHSH